MPFHHAKKIAGAIHQWHFAAVSGNSSRVINKQNRTSMTKNSEEDDDDKATACERRRFHISSAISSEILHQGLEGTEKKSDSSSSLADLQEEIKPWSTTPRTPDNIFHRFFPPRFCLTGNVVFPYQEFKTQCMKLRGRERNCVSSWDKIS
ncbi:hypothetical protein AVEN_69747-1 [Araneus ventricosus]|uniref:Uncharacterized protein n=1 Tax=Araneus ventricosus TaxID=182803 RepID=A0A4Y2CWQ9_ARAVE|nr:hypothetical protein AVEN_69747-1 [Araneus ventricosus]